MQPPTEVVILIHGYDNHPVLLTLNPYTDLYPMVDFLSMRWPSPSPTSTSPSPVAPGSLSPASPTSSAPPSTSSANLRPEPSVRGGETHLMATPRPSNLTGAEIYSLNSLRHPTPPSSTPRPSNFKETLPMS
ncbi:hypothetical protein Fmac_007207 [Flemingia macrophylla]|uniref:Uncharacterized protein n=1 Tax=Flemingia macrophylla TaxID=520843 RepID=A0ABD1NCT5_9FABA